MAAKPVIFTTATTNPAPNKAPEPFLVIAPATAGVAGLVTKQSALADEATANATDLATAQALANALKVKVNALLAKLRTAGILLP